MENAKKSFDIALGQMLRGLRVRSGYTQAQLGEIIGVTRSAFSYYESGKSDPGLFALRKLAAVFDIDPGDFFHSENFDPQKTGGQSVPEWASAGKGQEVNGMTREKDWPSV